MTSFEGHREEMETNRLHWDELVALHVSSEFYDVASFKAGKSSLLAVERDEVGDVRGKTLLHLQCHFGMDTLSWAREGAIVTGIDFSPEAISAANDLANNVGIEARFLQSNLYDLPSLLEGQFDVVFTSYGALCWLPDIVEWARIAASYVKPGGFFYVLDGHPMSHTLDYGAPSGELRVRYRYFDGEAMLWDEDGDYAALDAKIVNRRTMEFQHGLGEIVTSLIDAGLRIEFLHEFPFCGWQAVTGMAKGEDGYYHLPESLPNVPFLFSIRATKPD